MCSFSILSFTRELLETLQTLGKGRVSVVRAVPVRHGASPAVQLPPPSFISVCVCTLLLSALSRASRDSLRLSWLPVLLEFVAESLGCVCTLSCPFPARPEILCDTAGCLFARVCCRESRFILCKGPLSCERKYTAALQLYDQPSGHFYLIYHLN